MGYKITLMGGIADGKVVHLQNLSPRIQVPVLEQTPLIGESQDSPSFRHEDYFVHRLVDVGGIETWIGIPGPAESFSPLARLVNFYGNAHRDDKDNLPELETAEQRITETKHD